jgi:hypothetical protein
MDELAFIPHEMARIVTAPSQLGHLVPGSLTRGGTNGANWRDPGVMEM